MNDRTDNIASSDGSGRPVVCRDAGTDSIVTALLKAPHKVSDIIVGQDGLLKCAVVLLFTALTCHAVFGVAIGMFGGLTVALMDVVKVPLVALCSLLICFPSLYVFACVAGLQLSLLQAFVLGCSCAAMVGLILVGLAPVAWLFAVSTESLPFAVVLAVVIWLVALCFAARYVGKLRSNPFFERQAGIKVWFVILALVTLQMVTCMRPMLTKPKQGWWTGEKKFFLSHFGSSFVDEDDGSVGGR
jgi:hypothetical protein